MDAGYWQMERLARKVPESGGLAAFQRLEHPDETVGHVRRLTELFFRQARSASARGPSSAGGSSAEPRSVRPSLAPAPGAPRALGREGACADLGPGQIRLPVRRA